MFRKKVINGENSASFLMYSIISKASSYPSSSLLRKCYIWTYHEKRLAQSYTLQKLNTIAENEDGEEKINK